jgi:hypothetical protein
LAVLSGMSIVSQINSVIRLEGTQRETV